MANHPPPGHYPIRLEDVFNDEAGFFGEVPAPSAGAIVWPAPLGFNPNPIETTVAPDDSATALSPVSGATPARSHRAFSLVVVTGLDAGKTFRVDPAVDGGKVLVGQSPACSVKLADPTVSRVLVCGGNTTALNLASPQATKASSDPIAASSPLPATVPSQHSL